MEQYIKNNKKAWEYDAYNFWVKHHGLPAEVASSYKENPEGKLKKYAQYFDTYKDVEIANVCGSCGKKAIPLALLGANVTLFDFSEDNKRYATEVAREVNISLDYIVGDVLDIDMSIYKEQFDVVFMEGGILHNFHDINQFMSVLNNLLKPGGKLICSDFHPFTKISDTLGLENDTMDYFSTDIFEGEMAHARFYPDHIRDQIPRCSYRKYTVSEVLNTIIQSGFVITQVDEHPSWVNEQLPGELTVIGKK